MDTNASHGSPGVSYPTGVDVFRCPREAVLGSDRIFGSLMSQTLNLTISIAWDVYLLYAPDHSWDAELPPPPEFWMHQQDEDRSLYLDPLRFKQHLQTLLE